MTSRDVYVVYTGDRGVSKDSMIAKVQVSPVLTPSLRSSLLTAREQWQSRFGITLDPTSLQFIILNSRYLIEDSTWKRFTLAGQSFGSVLLAIEALWINRDAVTPDVWIGELFTRRKILAKTDFVTVLRHHGLRFHVPSRQARLPNPNRFIHPLSDNLVSLLSLDRPFVMSSLTSPPLSPTVPTCFVE